MEEQEKYFDLVLIILKNGISKPKRHGEYKWLVVFPGYDLCLDTWNRAITVYKNGQYWQSVGSDWGGLNFDAFWTNYWLAHLGKYK